MSLPMMLYAEYGQNTPKTNILVYMGLLIDYFDTFCEVNRHTEHTLLTNE